MLHAAFKTVEMMLVMRFQMFILPNLEFFCEFILRLDFVGKANICCARVLKESDSDFAKEKSLTFFVEECSF